jgi:membrane-bound ClpP family serine protease
MGHEKELRGDRPIQRCGKRSPRLRGLCMVSAIGALFLGPGYSALAATADYGKLKVDSSASQPGTVVLHWTGKVAAPMAQQIKDAYEQHKNGTTRVVLDLASPGGSVAEGERVI